MQLLVIISTATSFYQSIELTIHKCCRRGLGAARDLEKGELVLKVPKSALITRESLLLKDDKLSLALSTHRSLSPTQVSLSFFCCIYYLIL